MTESNSLRAPRLSWVRALARRRSFQGLILFLLLRMAALVIPIGNPEGGVLVDSRGYLNLAQGLWSTGSYLHGAGQDLVWPPGYPAFVVGASLGGPPDPVAVAVAQLTLTAALTLVLVSLGARTAGPAAGIAAGWLYALSPNTLLWSMTVMSEVLFAFLLAAALLLLTVARMRERWLGFLAAGAVMGLSALVRPVGAGLALLWPLAVLAMERKATSLRRSVGWAAWVVAGCLVILVPWMWRNQIVHGDFTVSTVGTKTFYSFNVASVLAQAEGITRDQAVQRIGESGEEAGASLRIIAAYPGVFLRQQLEGVLRATVGIESGVWARQLGLSREFQGSFGVLASIREGRLDQALERLASPFASRQTAPLAALFVFGVVFTLGLYLLFALALLRWRRWPPEARWLGILCLLTMAYLLVIPGAAGQARFRIPVEPMIALIAGFAWAEGRPAVAGRATP